MKKNIGLIGLGKMGSNLALNLKDHGWDVSVYNRTSSKTDEFVRQGLKGAYSIKELMEKLESPRIILLMLTAGQPTQDTIFGDTGLINYLEKDDIIIEAGNSFFKDDIANAQRLSEKGIKYIDAGVSGGPAGARSGACIMVGGKKETFNSVEELFKDISIKDGYKFFNGHGAGHYVKMIHNGIEYGMMQSLAEGFNLMKNSEYNLDLVEVADIYNHGSVIESRLVKWLQEGYIQYGQELDGVAGTVGSNGEGLWTVNTAKEKGLDVRVLESAVKFRKESQSNPSYLGQILSMLRNMFGGHSIEKNKNT
jgi:6-phosphogluconate dehydrogenase